MVKWLLTIAIVVIVLGLVAPRLRQGNGQNGLRRLPGDVEVRWRGKDYFFPFTTTVLISLLFIAISRLI
ncbi:MAG: hypothetical protein QG592_224 [Pseudomonadota bacterium]|jgi:hypothetical protein|nr:hypothetical protein [Pseudomonadota bacterium]MDQ5903058.1 hypothetical protein [Pseudomonadota bacterium]MDQ5906989.1 hypothetical protein [Pseudomonadota bacterium]MDQ5914753.1 hypothetical protein [Pseudomonadota bacterium]MDQ5942269.1 hypothetical protein [Pseudomonadota bacterium]